MIFVVLAVWLVGTWVTKFTLAEMASSPRSRSSRSAPSRGVILLWVKIVRESLAAAPTDP